MKIFRSDFYFILEWQSSKGKLDKKQYLGPHTLPMYEYTGTKNYQVAYIVQYVYEAKVLSLQSQCQSQKFEIFYLKISENFKLCSKTLQHVNQGS